jgi:hypothetical protein
MEQHELESVIQALAVTAEVTGFEITKGALTIMASDLAAYPLPAVLAAITRCRRELSGRMTLKAILDRIDDGRPGPEQAWAMLAKDELESCCMTDGEMNIAWGVALPLIEQGDKIAARMAFKEAYEGLVAEARAENRPVKWFVSLGFDPGGRIPVIEEAVRLGRIGVEHAQILLPHHELRDRAALTGPTPVGKILVELRKKLPGGAG